MAPPKNSVSSIYPGATTLAVIPRGPNSRARSWAYGCSPAFAAPYAPLPDPRYAAMELTNSTRPPGEASRSFNPSVSSAAVRRLSRKFTVQLCATASSGSELSTGGSSCPVPPALWISTSTAPSSRSTNPTTPRTWSTSPRSAAYVRAPGTPSFPSTSARRPSSSTVSPSAANTCAAASPIPVPPPLITTLRAMTAAYKRPVGELTPVSAPSPQTPNVQMPQHPVHDLGIGPGLAPRRQHLVPRRAEHLAVDAPRPLE